MRLALLAAGEPVHLGSLGSGALGGSETALLQAAGALAAQGHRVEVFANCPRPGSEGGLTLHELSQWPAGEGARFEAVIVSRLPELADRLAGELGPGARTVLWLHDILQRPSSLAPRLDRIDLILCLSRFHLDDTARRLPAAAGKLALTRNGLDLELIQRVRQEALTRQPGRAVYASRPERGLGLLLEGIWPRLKARRPELELNLCGYGIDEGAVGPDLAREYGRLRELAGSTPGVRLLGELAKPDYYRLLASSAFVLYPCTFAEISCLVALEAQALGTPILTSDRFALRETVAEPRFLIPGRPGGEDYQDLFLARSLELLDRPERALELAEAAGEKVRAGHDWVGIVREWVEMIEGIGLDQAQGREGLRGGASRPEEAEAIYDGASFEAINQEVLDRLFPDLCIPEGDGPAETILGRGPKGGPLLKAREEGGRWTALHSGYDPEAEAGRWAEGLDLEGAGMVVVLGFGLGYHLEALSHRLAEQVRLVVLDPGGAAFKAALKARDLRQLLGRPGLELILDRDPESALTRLGRLQIKAGFPALKTLVHRPSLRAMPQTHGLLAERLTEVQKVRLGEKLTFPKFRSPQVRVLILAGKYFLLTELKSSLARLGHEQRLVMIRDKEIGAEELIADLIREIVEFRPDFVLTVNHLGFDRDGILTGFLSQIRMPFASWYVDSPLLIIRHFQENRSPWGTIFLWDRDYLAELKALGHQHLHYLPLGTDNALFRPMKKTELPDWGRFEAAFVGNSMTDAVARKIRELNLPESLLPKVDQAAELFTGSPGYDVRPHLAAAGLLDSAPVDGFNEAELIDLEALILWRATQVYRLAMLKALKGLPLTVVGDLGWEDFLRGDGFRLHPPLNYYDHLPAFYNLCEINLNATSLQMKTGLNQRIFDVPACGGFLLTDDREQLFEHFEPDKETAVFSSPEEARDKAGFFLSHPEERERIAQAAHKRVLDQHTYLHRVSELIEVMRRNYKAMAYEGRMV